LRVADYAKKYHLTEQAIRSRIKRAGYTLSDLRQPGSNHFSQDGEKVIEELFNKPEPEETKAKGTSQGKTGTRAAGSADKLAVIRAERDELKLRTATAETLAAERQKTIDILLEQIREKDETINNLVAAAALRAALPAPSDDGSKTTEDKQTAKKNGILSWLRRMTGKGD